MSVPAGTPANDEIARVAHAIWEAEGRPEAATTNTGCAPGNSSRRAAQRSSFRRRRLPPDEDTEAPRPVQPGFEDTAPGMVPVMKDEPGEELREEPGGRFAKQLADLPDQATEDTSGDRRRPARGIRIPRRRRMPRATSRSRVRMTLPGAPLATIPNRLPQNHNQSLGGSRTPQGCDPRRPGSR